MRPRHFAARCYCLLWLAGLGLVSANAASAQGVVAQKYLLLRDKANSPFALSRPSDFLSPRAIQRRIRQNIALTPRDLPINPAYADAIRQTGARLWYTSRWLNAALVEATPAQLTALQQLPCVRGLESGRALSGGRRAASPPGGQSIDQNRPQPATRYAPKTRRAKKPRPVVVLTPIPTEPLAYGPSLDQVAMLGADAMHAQGFAGQGIWVAVLDGGFGEADQLPHFQHLFADNRLLGTYDFVGQKTTVFEEDSHGTHVLGAIAGYLPGKLIGTAYRASYLLLRTEKVGSESRTEEANWLVAAEYADSAGVDIINSSLGYTTFDDPRSNYTFADLDGRTALITRAAGWAAAAGMLVVNSAGNEGSNGWHYVTPPADGDSVLAVGSVNRDYARAGSSSVGPTADRRIKPDLVALGQGAVVGATATGVRTSSGTSFSAPLLAGLAAGLWQAFPDLTNAQVMSYLRQSASQAARPDSLLGYGIPNFARAAQLARLAQVRQTTADTPTFVLGNPFADGQPPQIWLGNLPKAVSYVATFTDSTGQPRWSGTLTQELTELPIPTNLPPGVYLLQLVNERGEQFSSRLIKR